MLFALMSPELNIFTSQNIEVKIIWRHHLGVFMEKILKLNHSDSNDGKVNHFHKEVNIKKEVD